MADTNTNFNFFDWTKGLIKPKGRYNAQGQWVTDEGVVADPYTEEPLDPYQDNDDLLLDQIKDTSEIKNIDNLIGAEMGPSNQQSVSKVTPSPVNNVPTNNSAIDPSSNVLDIVRGIAEDNPVQGAALNPIEPSTPVNPSTQAWADRFKEPIVDPDRPYVPVEGDDDLIMEPDSEFETTDIPEDRNEDFYDMLGLSRRERRKLEKERIDSGDDNVEEERPGKIPEGTSSYDARFQGDLDGDGYIDDAYLPKDTPASEEDLKGTNVENAPVTDKGDVTSTKKESTQAKSTDYVQRAQDINAKYKSGEINRFQRNRLNRKLRREIFKDRKQSGGKKALDKKTVEMMAGPVGKYVRNYPKRLKKNLGVLRDIAPDLLSAALQAEAGGMPSAGAGEGGGEAWSPEFFNQTVQLSNPYMNILNRIMGNRMDD